MEGVYFREPLIYVLHYFRALPRAQPGLPITERLEAVRQPQRPTIPNSAQPGRTFGPQIGNIEDPPGTLQSTQNIARHSKKERRAFRYQAIQSWQKTQPATADESRSEEHT